MLLVYDTLNNKVVANYGTNSLFPNGDVPNLPALQDNHIYIKINDDSEFAKQIMEYKQYNLVFSFDEKIGEYIIKEVIKIIDPNETDVELERQKRDLVNESKNLLEEFLQNNPLQFVDGKFYSVTKEKQTLLANALQVYQIKVQAGLPATLKWNATGEECTEWTLEDLSALALAIAEYVEPLVTHQQALEVQIRNCETLEELEAIEIDYESI